MTRSKTLLAFTILAAGAFAAPALAQARRTRTRLPTR